MLIATDPLSLLFIACFLFGLLFIVVSAFLGSGHGSSSHVAHVGAGHVGHVGDVGHTLHGAHVPVNHTGHVAKSIVPSHHQAGQGTEANNFSLFAFVNPISIALFLLGFGFFGYVSHNTADLIFPLAITFALLGGLVVAVLLLALISRVFGDSEGETVQDVSDRVGTLGKVSMTIREGSIGEVLYVSPGGMRKSVPARSVEGQRLERDQEVVIVNYQGGIAEVDTWDHFINRDDIPTYEKPDEDELSSLRALLENSTPQNTEIVMKHDVKKE
jgi:membrane protein implicated in regulation of membrane protease activity